MVCLGNICRSPMADGLLRSKVGQLPFHVIVDSAGTANYHIGKAPDHRMQQTARKNGVDISMLRARQFTVEDFSTFDLIYVMDKSNFENVNLLAKSKEDKQRVTLILNELTPCSNTEVPDPYYGGEEGFENVYRMLDKATDQIIEKLKKYER